MDKAKRNGRSLTWDEAYEEMVADSMEAMLTDGNVVQMMADLKQQDKTLWQKICDWFKNLADDLKELVEAYKGYKPDSPEGKMVADMQDTIVIFESIYADALAEASENFRRAEKNTTVDGGDIRYMVRDGQLTAESTEQERYEYLNKSILSVSVVDVTKIADVNLEDYNTRKKSAVTPGLIKLADSLGILNVDLKNSSITFPFQFSIKNLRKSLHHQLEYGGTYQDYVKAMSCFDELIANAIPIEVHKEKKKGTAKENLELQKVYVLVSAYREGKSIVPIQFEVKEFRGRNNTLYMTVALTKIDLEVVDTGVPGETGDVPHLFSRSTISLRQLFENVNPKDSRFLKYVPDGFLNDAQKAAKKDALLKQNKEYASYGTKKLSDRDPAAGRVNEVLQNENARLKEDVQYLKDLVKLQKTVTGGTKFTKTSVEAMAGNLIKANNVKGNKQELAKLLNDLYEYIAKGEELSWDGVKEMAQPAVDWLRKNTVIKSELSQYAREILHDVRTSRISLDESQTAEAAYRFGSYNDFRKAMMGSVIVSKDGVPLDIQWQEWSSMYPDIFDANTTASDMPGALADAISSLRNSDLSRAEYAYHADMIEQDLLQQVYDGYWRVSTLYTVADVKQREINALKGKHRQQMADLRQFHREKTDQLKREHRDEVKRIRKEYREDSQKKQREIMDRYEESRKRSVENRNKTAMRHKIQNVVGELKRLLLSNDKKDHVPDSLKKAVSEALDLLNTDPTEAESRAVKYADLIAREQAKTNPDQDKIDAYTVTMENILRQGEKMGQRIKDLKDAYEEIQKSDDPDIANAYDPVIAGAISELAETIGNTTIKNMTIANMIVFPRSFLHAKTETF